jgi:hypothetical protein
MFRKEKEQFRPIQGALLVKTLVNRFPWTARLLGLAAILLLASYRTYSQANGGPCVVTGNETLQIDSPRHQPGQTAHATGSGYGSSCNLTLTVSGPASYSTIATTDAGGSLSFSYPLGAAQGGYTVATFIGGDTDPWTSIAFTNGAFVEADMPDYARGNRVNLTGAGWQPGETVSLIVDELDGPDEDVTLTSVADAGGKVANGDFVTDLGDVGVHFRVTAIGHSSGSSTQTKFTDSFTATSRVTGNWNSSSAFPTTCQGAP